MIEDVKKFLLEHFPDRNELSYEDFTQAGDGEFGWTDNSVSRFAYDGDFELEKQAFGVVSRPWPEIDWFEIGCDGYLVPGCLNKKSFLHAFPSLLYYLYVLSQMEAGEEQEDGGLLSANFIETLDMNALKQLEDNIYGEGTFDWRRQYYYSLNDDVKKLIGLLLRMSGGSKALASFWGTYRDSHVGLVRGAEKVSELQKKLPEKAAEEPQIKGLEKAPEDIQIKASEEEQEVTPKEGTDKATDKTMDEATDKADEVPEEKAEASQEKPKGRAKGKAKGKAQEETKEAQEETKEAQQETKPQEAAQKNTQEKGQGKDQEEAQEKPLELEEEITWQVPMVIQDPVGHNDLMVQMERAAADFTLNDLDMAFRRIEAGVFVMGSDAEFRPIHIARPFYIGQFPVTQGQWLRVLGENPSFFDKGDNYPVDSVAWDEVLTFIAQLNDPAWWKDKAAESRKLRQFIARLNRAEGLDDDNGYVLRLPTEAEWEYACRAVSGIDPECPTVELQRWFFGNKMSDLGQYAWFSQNAGGTTHPVGEKRPNPWGLYDMYGNVEEWTWDCWSGSGSGDVTAAAELSSPVWGCCRRGGGWFSPGQRVGSACRSTDFATSLCGFAGLRLIIAPRLPAAKDKCMEEVYDQADYLFDLGFHDLARRLFACLAEDKYSEALNRLAIIYLGGYGVKMSKSRALSYLKKAARLKNPMAKLNLALFYKDDMKRYRRALRGFRVLEKDEKSDYRGEAAIEMAKMYMQGLGVRRNTGKAQKILDKLLDDVSLLERLPQGAREEILHLLKAVDSSR